MREDDDAVECPECNEDVWVDQLVDCDECDGCEFCCHHDDF